MNQNPYQPPDSSSSLDPREEKPVANSISAAGCALVLSTAFLGWGFAGVQMSITSLAMRPAAVDLLGTTDKSLIQPWYSWLVCAFLFGAAAGGFVLGRLGDRYGRAKAMGISILCYSLFSALTYFVTGPWQLLLIRFVTCMGIGGMWPNGIALVSEAWPNISRPVLAGVIGTAANVGIFSMSTLASQVVITPESWRWVMLVGAAPLPLAVLAFVIVPESPRWLAKQKAHALPSKVQQTKPSEDPSDVFTVFRPPLLRLTLIGIALGTVPLFGGWGSANWVMPWADKVGSRPEDPDPGLKARMGMARSVTGSVGSLLGGGLAFLMGRRLCYFLMSLLALGSAQYLFWFLTPDDPSFIYWFGALGLFSGVFFGWLPFCLPEMFPTHARSTGAGVSFNFGRILTAVTVFATGALVVLFNGDYAQIGRITSLIYVIGMVVIFFAPEKSDQQLED